MIYNGKKVGHNGPEETTYLVSSIVISKGSWKKANNDN